MIEMHLVVTNNKNENHLALVWGVVAACYQHHKQGATTPQYKSLSYRLQLNALQYLGCRDRCQNNAIKSNPIHFSLEKNSIYKYGELC